MDTPSRYVCTGTCGGSATPEEHAQGKNACGAEGCPKQGQPLTAEYTCKSCGMNFKEGEGHSHPEESAGEAPAAPATPAEPGPAPETGPAGPTETPPPAGEPAPPAPSGEPTPPPTSPIEPDKPAPPTPGF